MASLGVLNPSPMFFQYLMPVLDFLANTRLRAWNTPCCF